MKKTNIVLSIAFSVILTGFTLYALADTFLIEKEFEMPEQPVSTEEKAATEEPETQEKEPEVISTDTYYSDGNITVTITTDRKHDSDIYLADIELTSPEYLLSAFAADKFGKNIKEVTSVIAENNNAILAINGDFYGANEVGIVIRNGILFRSSGRKNFFDLGIKDDGTFYFFNESAVKAETLLKKGTVQTLGFGPPLVQDGRIYSGGTNGKAASVNPRTVIASYGGLHYLFAVVDGRTDKNRGMTFDELKQYMLSLGVENAYNLDGGGSATLYFNGKVVNNPSYKNNVIEERKVSDIVYIGY